MAEVAAQSSQLELAHVLFTDIVAFSKLPMEQQDQILVLLQQLVRGTAEYKRATATDQIISLPTGDGMALVFFGDPEAAVRCAQELAAAVQEHPELKLRIGVHSGPVYRMSDINANRNVTGGGINMAQRVMDCGDAGHILVSKTTADFLMQVGNWQGLLHDLGEAEVKHGVKLHIYNLYRTELGNPQRPAKLRLASRKRYSRRLIALTALLAIVAVASAAMWIRVHRMSLNVGLVSTQARRSVAVLGFKNLSGKADQAWLSTALAQMMATELSAGQKLRTIPGESVAQAKLEFAIPDVDSLTPETLSKIKKRLGADLVVLGSYVEVGGSDKALQIRLDVRLQNAEDGEVMLAAAEKGGIDNLFDLVTRCGQALRDRLSVGAVSAQQAMTVRASLPGDPEAARLYSQGLERLQLFDALGARDLLQKAIAVEPKSPQAHSALSAAWSALGYMGKAADEAKQAMDLATDLTREDRLWIEGQYHSAQKDWPRTVEIYQTLYGFYPDNLEYGLKLANAQTQAGKSEDALKTLEELRKLPAPMRDDPRIDLAEALAAETLGDSKRAAATNERAAVKAQAMGAKLLLAAARMSEGWNWRVLGDYGKSMPMLLEAKQIYEQAGDRGNMARTMGNIGATEGSQGQREASLKTFEKALAVDREIGNTIGVARMLQNIGFTYYDLGRPAQAKGYLEESLATSRSNGDREAAALTLASLSDFYHTSGDIVQARKLAQQSVDEAHEIGSKRTEAMSLAALAQMLAEDGNLPAAKDAFAKCLAIFREQGAQSLIITALQRTGQIEWSQGNLTEARKHLEEGIGIARQLGNAHDITISQENLAELLVDEGHAAAAIPALKAVIADFHAQQRAEDAISPTQYLGEALLATGNPGEAKKVLEGLRNTKGEYPNYLVEADHAVAEAELGDTKSAMARVQKILTAKDLTEFEERIQVRLCLAKIEVVAGRNAEAKALLEEIKKDADAKGYGLWSNKASDLLKTLPVKT